MTTEPSDKERALSEIRSDIETTRARLAETLDAIEERLNVPKRARGYVDDVKARFDALRRESPAVVYGALSGAAVLVLGTGVLIVRRATR